VSLPAKSPRNEELIVSRLSQERLALLAPEVGRPSYDRAQLQTGVVHLGLGAFHRAHQALYTETVLANNDARWGILGVSLRSLAVSDALRPQDGLYSVIERHGSGVHARVIGAVHRVLHAPTALAQVLDAIADPNVHVVTITVTEKGYCQHPASGDLDLDDGGIQHDLAQPESPQSTLGVLAAGIQRRPTRASLTVLCCDNMKSNGPTVQRLLSQYARHVDRALAHRIETQIAFPSTMVDRIVPAATPDSLAWAEQRLGLRDEAAIVCEPFTQWVIEDRFTSARPAWEQAGALFTGDVRPFEAMKLRLLNGTHSAIAYVGQLRGQRTVSDAMADPLVGPFARSLMKEDLRATVVAPSGFDVSGYCDQLLRRFENPALAHRTEQIAMDGTQKVPVRWLPPLRESLRKGVERPRLERALAAWLHYLLVPRDEAGEALTINDPGAATLVSRLRTAGDEMETVRSALAHASIFGDEAWPEAFITRLAAHLVALRRGGVVALIAQDNGRAGSQQGQSR
jgi:fructuronate reductase